MFSIDDQDRNFKFFMDKSKWTYQRYLEVFSELKNRGYE